jgi:hypothetical protein
MMIPLNGVLVSPFLMEKISKCWIETNGRSLAGPEPPKPKESGMHNFPRLWYVPPHADFV